LSFTGSAEVGHKLGEVVRRHGAQVQLEMGGKNPLLVMADADLELAVEVAARGTFGLTGQSCTATGRILIERSIHTEFVRRLVARAGTIVVGNGLEPGVGMGPKVARREADAAQTQIEMALQQGDAVLRHRSELRSAELDGGYFLPPVVLDEVRSDSNIATLELFSPIACVTPVESFAAGIRACNAGRFGLAASICTNNLASAHRFVDEIEAGVVKVNSSTTGLEIQMPFGGFRQSADGVHKELGLASFDFYTRLKSVYLNYPLPAAETN
jgi:aldehyde dehydrogenase (NAD+)